MKTLDFIFFDCMETLVDLKKLPSIRDYAAWAYQGSGVEELWKDFDEFFRYYLLARQDLASKLPEYADYEMRERFLHLVRLSLPDLPYGVMESVAGMLYKNYWMNYKSGSYVREDVLQVLPELGKQFKMGVVSNFMVMGGIEEMLELHDIRKHFNFVVTSVAFGWVKPHPAIYGKALELAGVKPERAIFIGDDYVNDFVTPTGLGMKAIFLDRSGRHPELENRAADFYVLRQRIIEVE